jgi:hypothetical protein
MQAYSHGILDAELIDQQRQYLVSARQRTQALISRLRTRLFSLESTLSQRPTPKRERKRLQQARWKTNKSLQICLKEEQVLSSNLLALNLKMQVQAQTHPQNHFPPHSYSGSYSSSNNTLGAHSDGSWPSDQAMPDAAWQGYPTTDMYEWFQPQWQGQQPFTAQLLDVRYNELASPSPALFQYPYEDTQYGAYPNFDKTFTPSDDAFAMIIDQEHSNELEVHVQPISMPGFDSFSWHLPPNSPHQWVNPKLLSMKRHARVESVTISPRTVGTPFNLSPISTTMAPPVGSSGPSSATTLRADAPPFMPTSPAYRSPLVASDVNRDESGGKRRYSAAAVDLIEYRIRQASETLNAKHGKYGLVTGGRSAAVDKSAAVGERRWSSSGHRKSLSMPAGLGHGA